MKLLSFAGSPIEKIGEFYFHNYESSDEFRIEIKDCRLQNFPLLRGNLKQIPFLEIGYQQNSSLFYENKIRYEKNSIQLKI